MWNLFNREDLSPLSPMNRVYVSRQEQISLLMCSDEDQFNVRLVKGVLADFS